MQNYHRNIKIPDLFVPFENEYNIFKEITLDKSKVNPDFLNWLEGIGLTFRLAKFFNSCPNQEYPLHIDGDTITDCVKLNLIYDSTDSKMFWYEPKEGYVGNLWNNVEEKPILRYEKENCNEVYSTDVNSNCLINGNVIHTLKNGYNNGQFRKCYSLFLINLRSRSRLKWEEALEIFEKNIIN